jgi:hypothetical protein
MFKTVPEAEGDILKLFYYFSLLKYLTTELHRVTRSYSRRKSLNNPFSVTPL